MYARGLAGGPNTVSVPVGAEGSLKTAPIVGSGRLKARGHVMRAAGGRGPNLNLKPGPLSARSSLQLAAANAATAPPGLAT